MHSKNYVSRHSAYLSTFNCTCNKRILYQGVEKSCCFRTYSLAFHCECFYDTINIFTLPGHLAGNNVQQIVALVEIEEREPHILLLSLFSRYYTLLHKHLHNTEHALLHRFYKNNMINGPLRLCHRCSPDQANNMSKSNTDTKLQAICIFLCFTLPVHVS